MRDRERDGAGCAAVVCPRFTQSQTQDTTSTSSWSNAHIDGGREACREGGGKGGRGGGGDSDEKKSFTIK